MIKLDRMKFGEEGYSIFEGILLCLLVGIILFVLSYVYAANKKTNRSLQNANNSSSSAAAIPKTNKVPVKTTN